MKNVSAQVLDAMHEREIVVRNWCESNNIPVASFYQVIQGRMGGRSRNDHKAQKIIRLLKVEGFLPVDADSRDGKAA